MPSPRKLPTDSMGPDLPVLVGQLLATTEAASEGIRSLFEESKANAKAIIAAATTLELVDKTVRELLRVVRDGNGQESLVVQIKTLQTLLARLRADHDDLRKHVEVTGKELGNSLDQMSAAQADLSRGLARAHGGGAVLVYVLAGAGWFITTVIALLALFRGN